MDALDWLSQRLSAALEMLTEADHLVVSLAQPEGSSSPRYVQFARVGEIRGESVGDTDLVGVEHLGDSARGLMTEIGWRPPDVGGNHWAITGQGHSLDELAAMAVRTLVEVHGVSAFGQLAFQGPAQVTGLLAASIPGAGELPVSLHYWDHRDDRTVACPRCGWLGAARQHQQVHEEVMDIECRGCGQLLLVAAFPTLDEARAAAAQGNGKAQAGLPDIERQAAAQQSRHSRLLRSPDELPDLEYPEIFVIWDIERGADGDQVLRCGDMEIWREPSFYESYLRFGEVFEILLQQYGDRFRGLHPTDDAGTWLYGDRLSSPAYVEGRNRSVVAEDRWPIFRSIHCSECQELASALEFHPVPGNASAWWWRYQGIVAGTGRGETVDAERAAIIRGVLNRYPNPTVLEPLGLQDDAGFCMGVECSPYPSYPIAYCSTHWNLVESAHGTCPKGHEKTFDPHWSHEW